MRRIPSFTTQFLRDLKRMKKRGKNITKIKIIIAQLNEGLLLDPISRDHKLSGEFKESRECHIESDWLLIYKIEGQHIRYDRTGTHSDLFD